MALPFNESVRTEVPLNPVPVSDQLVNSLTDQSLIKQAAQNIETAVVDIVGNCFAFGKNKTLNFQADLLAFNPKWIHEKPSLRSFIEMTENSSDITKRNLCSWIVIWAEGRQAYHTPGVVDCINNFTKKSNPEACLRPFYSLDFDKIKTLPNSTIEEPLILKKQITLLY